MVTEAAHTALQAWFQRRYVIKCATVCGCTPCLPFPLLPIPWFMMLFGSMYMCVSRRQRGMERREAGEENAVIVLIYRAAWLGEIEEREKRDNAIVRSVFSWLFTWIIGIEWDKDITSRGRISVQADRQGGGETDGWWWREGEREGGGNMCTRECVGLMGVFRWGPSWINP